MWCLVSASGNITYNVTPGRVHVVSRKTGDIILATDGSVSRKHAYLEVKHPIKDGICVWDENSKYGTFVNEDIARGKRLDAGVKATLREGDTVRFGLQDNVFKLQREIPIVCSHLLKAADKTRVKSVVSKVGGKLIDNWNKKITHLTTNSVRLTYEVMCALASAKPIVSPLFWEHYALMLEGRGALADPSKFIPPLDDKRLLGRENLVLPNHARKDLFKEKHFIFPSSQSYEALRNVVQLAGGRASKLSDCDMSLEDYCKPNIVVLHGTGDEQTPLYNRVLNNLTDKNMRVIQEEDIGLAIWKVSTTVHCNPAHCVDDILRQHQESRPDTDTGATLVMNTEDIGVVSTGQTLTNQVIPPTYSENLFSSEDKTQSFSLRPVLQRPEPGLPESSRKRHRDSSTERADLKTAKEDLTSSSIKRELKSPDEEDLFAEDEIPIPSTSNSSIVPPAQVQDKKNIVTAEKDDDFYLPSPPKRKKFKKPEVQDNMFELPAAPPSTFDDDDDFDLSRMRKSIKLNKTANSTVQNESRDMFESTRDIDSSASTSRAGEKRKEKSDSEFKSHSSKKPRSALELNQESDSLPSTSVNQSCDMFESSGDMDSSVSFPRTGGKRKQRDDTESENRPPKKLNSTGFGAVNVHAATKVSATTAKFISKDSIKLEIKKEDDPESNFEDDLASRLQAKVVVTSLIKGPRNRNNDTTVNNGTSVKNFKKFRKVWAESTLTDQQKLHVTTSRFQISASRRSSNGMNSNSDEDGDEPSIAAFAPARRNNVPKSEDEDDEFALPSFSQV